MLGFLKKLANKNAIGSMIQGGIDAGATPNIAGGGGVDVLRGMQAAAAHREQQGLDQQNLLMKAHKLDQFYEKLRHDAELSRMRNSTTQRGQDFTKEVGSRNAATGERRATTGEGRLTFDRGQADISNSIKLVPFGMKMGTGGQLSQATPEEMSPVVRSRQEYTGALTDQAGANTESTRANAALTQKKTDRFDEVTDTNLARTRAQTGLTRTKIDSERALQTALAGGAITPKQADDATKLGQVVTAHPAYKDMLDVKAGWDAVQTGVSAGNGNGDLAAINGFQRMIDPGATVREGDVHILMKAAGLFDKASLSHIVDSWTKGAMLPPEVRQRMLEVARNHYGTQAAAYDQAIGGRFKKIAAAKGIPYEFVSEDFTQSIEIGPIDPGVVSPGMVIIDIPGVGQFEAPADDVDGYLQAHPGSRIVQ